VGPGDGAGAFPGVGTGVGAWEARESRADVGDEVEWEEEREERTAPSEGRRTYVHLRPAAVSECKSALPGD
jgi:hypothetical protein